MRPARYHFPDEVRSATREMAARTVRDRTVAQTPEELDAWISRAPDLRGPLEHGGYATEFTAGDLFPLYAVMVEKAGGAAGGEAAAPSRAGSRVAISAAIGLAVAVVVALVIAFA